MELRKKLEEAINMVSAENGSNTPDFVLAEYLTDCLAAFDKAVKRRESWYGVNMYPGWNSDKPETLSAPIADVSDPRRA
jgi:hypothetical protein